ncbi:hypothetical protein L596_021552 [Steinernema carpocapsae]|uniref:Uncharacterized protein n=1 Tax=Steinernema carpocapsae TaxID=34508 RepID=A0A4U5MJ50_STECR|nr:hypothetical protein L596_021552 [Steinernema carpocapsae]
MVAAVADKQLRVTNRQTQSRNITYGSSLTSKNKLQRHQQRLILLLRIVTKTKTFTVIMLTSSKKNFREV